MTRLVRTVVACLAAGGLLLALAGPAVARVEDYARYQPQSKCSPHAKAGTLVLARWLVRRGGGDGPISRPCKVGGVSEHKEGRAIDWTLDAGRRKHRELARSFLDTIFAEDKRGNAHARARRMGVMYVIWNDHMYAAWDDFSREDYLSSGCRSRKKCSTTLRHRDHMHISLTRKGGRGVTSWYDGRVNRD